MKILMGSLGVFCFLFFFNLFIFGCAGSSFLCKGFLQLRQAGATFHRGARASHYRGLSCCGAQAPDAQAQQLWLTGLVAPQHVGFPRPGLEPVSPALAGRFSTTAPPGKPWEILKWDFFCFPCGCVNWYTYCGK